MMQLEVQSPSVLHGSRIQPRVARCFFDATCVSGRLAVWGSEMRAMGPRPQSLCGGPAKQRGEAISWYARERRRGRDISEIIALGGCGSGMFMRRGQGGGLGNLRI